MNQPTEVKVGQTEKREEKNNMIRHYYTLEELFPNNFNLTGMQTLVTAKAASATTLNTKFAQVLNILNDEYHDWFVGYLNKLEPETEEVEGLQDEFVRKLCVIYNFTEKRYLALLGLYDAQATHLMDQLNMTESVEGTRRVNDTPQDGGDFTDDNHSNLYENNGTSRTVDSDPTTVMSRLKEIQDSYMNLIRDWSREFSSLFIVPHREFEIIEEEGE